MASGVSIIEIIVALVAGAISSLVAPWAHWGIEKKRKIMERRINLLEECKKYLEMHTFHKENFIEKPFYSSLRQHLSPALVKKLESSNEIQIGIGGRGEGIDNLKPELLDEIYRIEKDWGLI